MFRIATSEEFYQQFGNVELMLIVFPRTRYRYLRNYFHRFFINDDF